MNIIVGSIEIIVTLSVLAVMRCHW